MENKRVVVFRKLASRKNVNSGLDEGLHLSWTGADHRKLMRFDKVYAYGPQNANRKIKYSLSTNSTHSLEHFIRTPTSLGG
jgi:hypothetical protein